MTESEPKQPLAVEVMSNEDIIRRLKIARKAIAILERNIRNRTNMSDSSHEELKESSEEFHSDIAAYTIELERRGIDLDQ